MNVLVLQGDDGQVQTVLLSTSGRTLEELLTEFAVLTDVDLDDSSEERNDRFVEWLRQRGYAEPAEWECR